jgi:hypothetical protein
MRMCGNPCGGRVGTHAEAGAIAVLHRPNARALIAAVTNGWDCRAPGMGAGFDARDLGGKIRAGQMEGGENMHPTIRLRKMNNYKNDLQERT